MKVAKSKAIGLVELHTVFEIAHGNKFDLNKMTQCRVQDDAVAFVGRSGAKNGISAFVRRLASADPFEKGLITVALGGSTLSSFVQPRPFYTAQNIDVLKPHASMSLDAKLYYCLCIESNRFRYSTFGREANRTLSQLLVPRPADLPKWIAGATEKAIADLNRDLLAASKV